MSGGEGKLLLVFRGGICRWVVDMLSVNNPRVCACSLSSQDRTGVCMPDPMHADKVTANSPTSLHAAAEMGHREIMQEFVLLCVIVVGVEQQ